MSDYVLSCESTVDLTPEKIHELGLECIYFHFYIDGVEYPDDLGQTIPFDKFISGDERWRRDQDRRHRHG